MDVQIGPEGTATVILDGSGNGTAKIGPISSREVWSPTNVHVKVASFANEATCKIYVGDGTTDNNFRDATFSGSSGDSTDKVSSDTLKCGDHIFAVWTSGDPGAQATMNTTGVKTI